MKLHTIIAVSTLVIAMHLFTSCGKGNANNIKIKPKKMPLVSVQKSKIQKMVNKIRITGTIEANVFSEIVSPVDGVLESLYARENQRVKKGSIIAIINPNQRLSLMASNSLKLEQLQNDLVTKTKGTEAFIITGQQLKTAEENMEYAQNMYQVNPVICPANGLVTERWSDEGTQLITKDKILKITDMSSLVIKAEVNEQYFEAIQEGKELNVKLNAYPNDSLIGIVQLIYPQLSPETRGILFDIKIKNFQKKILPGMMAVIELPVHTIENAVVVNADAILSSPDNTQFVFIVDADGNVKKHLVETGISMGDLIEIKGISADEKIIVKGQEMLKEDVKVKIVNSSKNK